MKKTITAAVALLFLLGLTNFTFAQVKQPKPTKTTQENVEVIRGRVVSVDPVNKTIVVTDNKTQTNKSFVVSEKAIKAVKVGDEVKVKVKVGSTNAESLKILKSEVKKK